MMQEGGVNEHMYPNYAVIHTSGKDVLKMALYSPAPDVFIAVYSSDVHVDKTLFELLNAPTCANIVPSVRGRREWTVVLMY